jgi:hypothetical protein
MTTLPDNLVADPSDGPALYFLFRGEECVYIGSSVSPKERVGVHRNDHSKEFDRVAYLPTHADDLEDNESHWISLLSPMHNKLGNANYVHGTPIWGTGYPSRKKVKYVNVPIEEWTKLNAISAKCGQSVPALVRRAVRELLNEST